MLIQLIFVLFTIEKENVYTEIVMNRWHSILKLLPIKKMLPIYSDSVQLLGFNHPQRDNKSKNKSKFVCATMSVSKKELQHHISEVKLQLKKLEEKERGACIWLKLLIDFKWYLRVRINFNIVHSRNQCWYRRGQSRNQTATL